MKTLIAQHIASRRDNQARRLVVDVKRRIDSMPECQAKLEYQEAVQEQWGHLLKGVELVPKADTGEG